MTGPWRNTSSPRTGPAGDGTADDGANKARSPRSSRRLLRSVLLSISITMTRYECEREAQVGSELIACTHAFLREQEMNSIDQIQRTRQQSYALAKGNLMAMQRKLT